MSDEVVKPAAPLRARSSGGASWSPPSPALWASGAGAPAFPRPDSVDERSVDAVALAGARALASADTAVDTQPQHTAVRAALAGWLTPAFACAQSRASIEGPPGAEWDAWVRHRAYVVVRATLSGDDHPPDSPTTAARMVQLTEQAIGRGGWRDKTVTAVVAVVLNNVHGVWRIDSDQLS
jgi:hypothetical protein